MGAAKAISKLKRRSAGLLLICLGIALIMFGAGLYIYRRIENFFESHESAQIVGSLIEAMASSPDSETNETLVLNGDEYAGIIELPSLNLTLPVLSTCAGGNLDKGACLYYSDENYVIGGHNRESQFQPIFKLKINDKLVFYDTHANKKEYTLVKTEILLPDVIEDFTTNKYGVTLFTCFWDNSKRYVLRFI